MHVIRHSDTPPVEPTPYIGIIPGAPTHPALIDTLLLSY